VNGWIAALFVVSQGNLDIIDAGIDLNQYNNDQITPLMLAASQVNQTRTHSIKEGECSRVRRIDKTIIKLLLGLLITFIFS
jgi:hypothetical protein